MTIQNVRNCEFLTYRDCLVDYYDKTYDLKQIQSVDFIVVPFSDNKAIAHTMLSFGFANGDHVGISVEVRLESGEKYDAARGLLGEYELVYVIADERELKDAVREELDRQLAYFQQKRVRQQITSHLIKDAKWDLPEDLLRRQYKREIERSVLELRSSGFRE